jgi:hypothetical protein
MIKYDEREAVLNMEKATEVLILAVALLPVLRVCFLSISPKVAGVSADRRAVVRVLCRLCGDRDRGGALFAVDAADSCCPRTAGGSLAFAPIGPWVDQAIT